MRNTELLEKIDAAIAENKIEVGAVKGAVAGLLKDNVVLADDDVGMQLGNQLCKSSGIEGIMMNVACENANGWGQSIRRGKPVPWNA